ncbi:hypothetical protein Poli38472_003835 [Pythium oligandrum]|uniref:TRP C-terminal domain-containing protein n=1 Tax=Pythium oligandrum TaxID=41045 RepID=A0A8K1CMK3_PYTOL|nr:hypothetical protein Poli38472_003835 [Pythium oligandrum]|eukprot:TMW66070.1 hypothetical protein Poli38472_003835 [Pythium oligandrum]
MVRVHRLVQVVALAAVFLTSVCADDVPATRKLQGLNLSADVDIGIGASSSSSEPPVAVTPSPTAGPSETPGPSPISTPEAPESPPPVPSSSTSAPTPSETTVTPQPSDSDSSPPPPSSDLPSPSSGAPTPSSDIPAPSSDTPAPPTDPSTAPPTDPTTAPPTDPTTAPPTDPTTAPPTDPTTAPPTDPSTAPPTDPTTAPPTDPTTAPPTDPTTAPPTDPTTAPPTDPTTAPPTDPTTAPPTDPTTAPPTDPTTAPPTDPTTAPPTDPTTAPPTDPTTAPPTDPTTAPPTDPTTAPPTDPTTAPPTDPTTAPPTDPTTAPPTDPTTAPPTDPTTAPPTDPTTAPPTDPSTAPPTDPTTAPPTDPTTAPPTDPTTAPPTDPTTAPPTDPTTAPPTDPTTAPPTDPTTAPPTDPTTAPPTDPTTAPPTDPVDPPSSSPPSPPPTVTDGEGPKPTTAPPPVVSVDVGVETNAPTRPSKTEESSTSTPSPVINKEADKQDIIVFNSSDATSAPAADPFKITVIEDKTEKPVVLDIQSNSATTETPKPYVRGDLSSTPEPTIEDGSNSNAGTSPGIGTDEPNVIGGRRRNSATDAESLLSKSSAAFHDFLRYAACAFAGISVALLLFFHYVSLDATLTWTNSSWSPNTWEFLLFVGYLQQMASVGQLTLLKTPYFLWDFSDSFAWTNFLIQRSVSSDSRRLETIVLGGVVAYADRLGINESKILVHSVIGFVVVFGVLISIFFVVAMLAKRKAEQAMDDPSNLNNVTHDVHRLRSASIRTLGLCVLIWYFSLYPLSLYASFEISMEVQAKSVAGALALAIIALAIICFGILAWAGRVILHQNKEQLLQFENIATWGSLYAEYTYRSRMFFIVGALVQITTGILIGSMDSDPTQLIVVIAIEAIYLLAVFVMTPFAETLVQYFTYGLGFLKILNYGLAFAFLNSNTMNGTSRSRVANAFIGINTIVILAWFIRQLVVFSSYIRAWSHRTSFEELGHGEQDPAAKYEVRTASDSDAYASVSTARHGDGNSSMGNASHGPSTVF